VGCLPRRDGREKVQNLSDTQAPAAYKFSRRINDDIQTGIGIKVVRITVIRKGSRAIQQLPASPDAFVWLRLYHQ
jgi:hypothetical protein